MAKASDQFRQSDVTSWGAVALVAGAIAVLGANVSTLLPQGMLAGLHQARLQGATLDQLRIQVSYLREQTLQLRRENSVLVARFALEEQQGNSMQQRVGALEVSLPKLLEALPETAQIDRTNLTASIGDDDVVSFEAEGGSVEVRQRPMIEALPPLPANADPVVTGSIGEAAFGIAIGPSVTREQAPETWRDLTMKLGPLLLGLDPLLADSDATEAGRILAGPIAQLSEATALCQRLERVSIPCTPTAYAGTSLPL